ncbi:hypothetical protein ACFL2K_05105 [Candidatus Margulisiibacteriota bacterium]
MKKSSKKQKTRNNTKNTDKLKKIKIRISKENKKKRKKINKRRSNNRPKLPKIKNSHKPQIHINKSLVKKYYDKLKSDDFLRKQANLNIRDSNIPFFITLDGKMSFCKPEDTKNYLSGYFKVKHNYSIDMYPYSTLKNNKYYYEHIKQACKKYNKFHLPTKP